MSLKRTAAFLMIFLACAALRAEEKTFGTPATYGFTMELDENSGWDIKSSVSQTGSTCVFMQRNITGAMPLTLSVFSCPALLELPPLRRAVMEYLTRKRKISSWISVSELKLDDVPSGYRFEFNATAEIKVTHCVFLRRGHLWMFTFTSSQKDWGRTRDELNWMIPSIRLMQEEKDGVPREK